MTKKKIDEKLLERVKLLEMKQVPVIWIPNDGSSYVEDHGFRAAVVIAGENGYRMTGNWPYTGQYDEKMPWFWGPTLKDAEKTAALMNERVGVGVEEAELIVGRSMTRSRK